MGEPRAADDFAAIRARMEELRQERQQATAGSEIVAPRPHTISGDIAGPAERSPLSPVFRRLLARQR